MASEVSNLLRWARKQGYETVKTRGGHLYIKDRNGRVLSTMAGSSGSKRIKKNLKTQIKRAEAA